jgi:hypothetical protein
MLLKSAIMDDWLHRENPEDRQSAGFKDGLTPIPEIVSIAKLLLTCKDAC